MSRFGDMRFLSSSSSSLGGRFSSHQQTMQFVSPPPLRRRLSLFPLGGGGTMRCYGPKCYRATVHQSLAHMCAKKRLTFAKKIKGKQNIFFEVRIAFLLREIFLKEKSFTSLTNAIHCCMQVGLSKGEERRRGSPPPPPLYYASLFRLPSPPTKRRLTTTTQQPLKSTHFLHNLYASLALASDERRRAFPPYYY